MAWDLEITDTFAGEANYSWVRRDSLSDDEESGKSNIALVREFKLKLGLTGIRGRSVWHNSDFWEFRPYGYCQVAFAIYRT